MIVPKMDMEGIINEFEKSEPFIITKTKNIAKKYRRLAIKKRSTIRNFIITKDKNNNDWFIYLNVTKKAQMYVSGIIYYKFSYIFCIVFELKFF